MIKSREIGRVKQVLESDRTGMTIDNLSVIAADVEKVIDDYFERKSKTSINLIETDGEYKLRIEAIINDFKSFNSIK